MARSNTMRLEDLCEDSPVLYHRYALSQVMRRRSDNQSRRLPTQLVYPDGSISIGFPPTPLKAAAFPLPGSALPTTSSWSSQSEGAAGAPPSAASSDAAATNQSGEENGSAQNQAVVYVSETPVSRIGSKYRTARGLLVLAATLQCCQILSLFLGGPLVSVVDVSFSPGQTGAAVQRVYYLGCLAFQFLLALALSLRSPLVLTIYGALQTAAAVGGAAMWLSIDVDVLVMALALASRVASSEVASLLMPHAFVAAQAS